MVGTLPKSGWIGTSLSKLAQVKAYHIRSWRNGLPKPYVFNSPNISRIWRVEMVFPVQPLAMHHSGRLKGSLITPEVMLTEENYDLVVLKCLIMLLRSISCCKRSGSRIIPKIMLTKSLEAYNEDTQRKLEDSQVKVEVRGLAIGLQKANQIQDLGYNLENIIEDETLEIDEIVNIKESRNHPLENVIGNLNQRTLRSQAQNQSNFYCFISTIEPKNVNEALGDKSWIVAMQEELNQFIANDVWELVPQPKNMTIIGTKWVFRNKLDENGIVSRNKARLVAQGYNQQEGIDYDETYARLLDLNLLGYYYPMLVP
ncbi:retrovirus-related pol polyprotein from transposon TNT 1-94 [Tanacetum coccineum]